jgi:enoyl-CoA hydratase/carnithine racemase
MRVDKAETWIELFAAIALIAGLALVVWELQQTLDLAFTQLAHGNMDAMSQDGLMYSGEIIDAQRALEIGLVGRVVTPEKLLNESKAFAQRMAAGAPMATHAVKELTYGALSMPYDIFNVEKTLHLQETSNSEDASEGVQSFLEKRPPVMARTIAPSALDDGVRRLPTSSRYWEIQRGNRSSGTGL